MKSPQKVQMFLLSNSEKSSYNRHKAFEKYCPPKAVSTEEKSQKKFSVLAQQCEFQLVW